MDIHFLDEETEAQRGWSYNQQMDKLGSCALWFAVHPVLSMASY